MPPTHPPLRRALAWTLVAATLAPLATPAFAARDTDIYLGVGATGSAATPNVLVVLDTSNSMNVPEPWREYPGAYDSHVEYLWNDPDFIASIGCKDTWTCRSGAAAAVEDARNETLPTNPLDVLAQGYFKGATAADRLTFKQTALTYAAGTETGDPGPRTLHRNYSGVEFFSGNTSGDARPAFRGAALRWLPAGTAESDARLRATSFNQFMGADTLNTWGAATKSPVIRGNINYGQAGSSDGGYPWNNYSGYNQCAASASALTPSTVYTPSVLRRNSGKWLNQQWLRWDPAQNLDTSHVASYPGTETKNMWGQYAGYLDQYRDANGGTSSGWASGDGDRPLPVRIPKGSSFAGWADLSPDFGGYHANDRLYWDYWDLDMLKAALAVYGIVPTSATLDGARVEAYKAIAIPGYYDVAGTVMSGGSPDKIVTKTRACTPPGSPSLDAYGQAFYTGSSCTDGGVSCSSADAAECALVPDPPACAGTSPAQAYVTRDNASCAWAGRQTAFSEGTTYFHGGTCQGQYRTPPGSAWTTGATSACSATVQWASLTVNGTTLNNVRTDNGGCSDLPDTSTTCDAALGTTCISCTAKISSANLGGGVPGTTENVFNRDPNRAWMLPHDCVADNASGTYLLNTKTYKAPLAAWTGTDSHTTDAAKKWNATGTPAYDVYHPNYLNWKYGPKGPNGHPIGRKTRLQIAKDALADMIVGRNNVNIGLMVFNKHDGTTEGGYIASTIKPMGTSDPAAIAAMSSSQKTANDTYLANRQALIDRIYSVEAMSNTPLTESLYEAYLYFAGKPPKFGTLNSTADGRDPAALPAACNGAGPCAANYSSPVLALKDSSGNPAACQKNYILLITDGGPTDDHSANTEIKAATMTFTNESGVVISPRTDLDTSSPTATAYNQLIDPATGNPYGPVATGSEAHDAGYIWMDELAYYMANSDVSPHSGATDQVTGVQTVSTFTIGFAGANTPVLKHTATAGQGANFEAQDAATLAIALDNALAQILSWTPLAASTVPTSRQNRASSGTEVYMAFFGPSSSRSWDGTVKRYNLSQGATACGQTSYKKSDGSVGQFSPAACLTGQSKLATGYWNIEQSLVDKDNNVSHRINPEAASFWMPSSFHDGGSPRRGGTGETLINSTAPSPIGTPDDRKVYTYQAGSNPSTLLTHTQNLLAKGNNAIKDTTLGAGSDSERAALINFARGGDPNDSGCASDDPTVPCAVWRTWAHGSVVHSKPVLVSYASDQRSLFYVTTEGRLHAVNPDNGKERWSFLAEEALPLLKSMRENLPGEALVVADTPPALFFHDENRDGQINRGDGDRVYVYFGQRRGGSAYYALDVTDPDDPRFMWKIIGGKGVNNAGLHCEGKKSCSKVASYDELGQTWSTPAVVRLRALGKEKPALVFGGGYDPNQDLGTPASDTMGRALYVVDGTTGDVLRQFTDGDLAAGSMAYSLPADPVALNTDMDGQGLADRVYIGDTGGNLFRFDVDDATPGNWTGGRIANLSATGATRKILFAPVMVKESYKGQDYDAVYVGTGDREKPLNASATDLVAMVKDPDTGLTSSYALAGTLAKMVDTTDIAGSVDASDSSHYYNEAAFNSTVSNTTWAARTGWYYRLPTGKKVVNAMAVLENTLYVPTYSPSESLSDCLPNGLGEMYVFNARSGTAPDFITGTKSGKQHILFGTDSRGYMEPMRGLLLNGKPTTFRVNENARVETNNLKGAGTAKIFWYRERTR